MTLEEAQEVWSAQGTSSSGSIEDMLRKHHSGRERLIVFSWLAALISVVMWSVIFYGCYVVNGESLVLSSLRAATGLLGLLPHLAVTYQLRRQQKEWGSCQLSQKECLTQLVQDLRKELSPRQTWVVAFWFTLIVAMIALVKWLDFRQGGDTLAECIGIVAVTIAIMTIIAIAAWHYQKEFLVPRLRRFEMLLCDLETE